MQDADDEPFELAPPPPHKPKTERPWLLPVGLAAGLFIVYATSVQKPFKSPEETQAEEQAQRWDQEWRAAVIKELMSGTIIKDASWGGPSSLRIGVLDDGTRRTGLAMYACEVVRMHRPSRQEAPIISVMDIAKVVIAKEWVQLERYDCR